MRGFSGEFYIIIIFWYLRENKKVKGEIVCIKVLRVYGMIKFSYFCFLEKRCFYLFILIRKNIL